MKIAFLILFGILTVSCNYSKIKGSSAKGDLRNLENFSQPDFKAVSTVIDSKCTGCHSNRGGNAGGVNLENYPAVRAKLNRVLYRSIETRDMPPRKPLTDTEMQLLQNWADSGAPETVIGIGEKPSSDIEKGPNNWAKIKDKIFASKCLMCHRPPDPDGHLDLTDILQVRGKAPEIFDRVIMKQDMPIAPIPAVTPRERRVLLKWFDAGMPE